tara:strand:- start:865 stop:1122 length:258 start_codon:yes stop_codon:yes gene_type:complete
MNVENTIPFKNTSIFSGVAAYIDDEGKFWRRMNEGGSWMFYLFNGDSYILECVLRKRRGNNKIKTIKYVHNMMIDHLNLLDSYTE